VAKRKATSSGKAPAAASKRKSTESSNGASSAPAKKSATSRAISSEEIGKVAGEVWELLSSNGGQTLAAIKKSVDAPSDVVLAAIGWLAREDKLDFASSGRTVKIALRS
jgi:Winged helix-turn-helix domain (DUF2582)